MLERRTLLAGVAASCFLAANANAQWSELFKRGESLLRGDSERDEPGLSEVEITLGLKEALHIGATRVIRRVGRVDGYNDDPDIRLPLPGSLRPMQYAFRTTGVSGLLDDLQFRLNRAAEVSAPKRKTCLQMPSDRCTSSMCGASTTARRMPQHAISRIR